MDGEVCLRFLLVVLLALASNVGCGGSGGDPNDAGAPDAFVSLCPVPDGRTYVLTQFRFLPSDQGYDLDGDGAIDNEIGKLPQSVLDSVHEGMDDSFAVGEFIELIHVTDWTEPPTPDDEEIGLHVFSAVDADHPVDPSNNYDGQGAFYLRREEFDVACNSTTEAEEAVLVDRVLTAENGEWAFPLGAGAGTLRYLDAIMVIAFEADFESATGTAGAMSPLCSLSVLGFPGDRPGSVLDAFVNDPIIADTISVDMDVDGDGLEQVVGDGVTILECIDGDGTVIPGRDCPCHPRIADAYSLLMGFPLVPATILGVE